MMVLRSVLSLRSTCFSRKHFRLMMAILIAVVATAVITTPAKATILVGKEESPIKVASPTAKSQISPVVKPTESLTYSVQRQKLLATYKAQIIAYQAAYQQFRLAKGQYQKTQTIRSLSEAINATKLAVLKRNEVLSTYIEILHLDLLQKQISLDPSLRAQLIKETESLLEQLKQRHHQMETVVSRDQLAAALSQYDKFFDQIVSLAYKTRFVLKADGLFELDAKLKNFRNQISQQAKQADKKANFKSIEFKRGLDEVDRELIKIDHTWQLIKHSLKQKNTAAGWFRAMNKSLSQVYTTSLRTNNYLIELLQIN